MQGPQLRQRRVALISTAGVHLRSGRPFGLGSGDYRVIPGDTDAKELLMSHVSSNFDRTGFQDDWNVIFPPDRLRELESRGLIGSVADDLKAFYTEAVTAHQGQTTVTSGQLAGWFWS